YSSFISMGNPSYTRHVNNYTACAYLPKSQTLVLKSKTDEVDNCYSSPYGISGAVTTNQLYPQQTTPVLPFGANNFFPNQMVLLASQHLFLPTLLGRKKTFTKGEGIHYTYREVEENGKRVEKFVKDAEVDDFLKLIDIDTLIELSAENAVWHENIYWEVIRNNRKEIISATCHDVTNCRLSREQKSLFVYQTWNDIIPHTNYEEIPLYANSPKNIQKKFILHAKDASSGSVGYGINPGWSALNAIQFGIIFSMVKKAAIKKAASIRYVVKMPVNYFEELYPDGAVDEKGVLIPNIAEYRVEKEEEFHIRLDQFLSDPTNTSGTFITKTYYDTVSGQKVDGIEIVSLKDEINYEAYLTDAGYADVRVISAFGLAPSVAGIPVDSRWGQSGSELRGQTNLALLETSRYRQMICKLVNALLKDRFPNKDLKFKIETYQMVTTDLNKTGIISNP
ncbi:MAG: hypothetical protein ACRCXN_11255, partial [Bacteroidales bacterium]